MYNIKTFYKHMKNIMNSYSFITVGKTVEQKGGDFKRYVGLGQSKVIALNPTKKQLEEIYGREIQNDPEYYGTDDETGTKWARFDFVVKTDPEFNNGIELISHAVFTLRNEMYANKDNTKVRVIDSYGNSIWMDIDSAKAKTVPTSNSGGSVKMSDYRIALRGEPELIDFLRNYFSLPDAFEYANGTWSLKKLKHQSELTKEEAEKDDILTFESCMMAFDKSDFEKFFKGDVSDLANAINSRKDTENLAVTLLYGVRTTDEGKQYQTVCTGYDLTLRKNAGSKAIARLEKQLANAKQSGLYSAVDYRVQELQEYTVEPTNLEKPQEESSVGDMPWD